MNVTGKGMRKVADRGSLGLRSRGDYSVGTLRLHLRGDDTEDSVGQNLRLDCIEYEVTLILDGRDYLTRQGLLSLIRKKFSPSTAYRHE